MYVISFSSISDDMDFTVDLYFRQFWIDPRLAFRKSPGLDKLKLNHDFGKMIWIPDTFFVNEKESFLHDVTTKNEFIKVDHTGEVVRSVRWGWSKAVQSFDSEAWLSYRLSITASCPMNLRSFPMDTQICSLDIESCKFDLNCKILNK